MKKVLLILLCLVFVASIVEAKIVKDTLYQIPKTKVAPVIDGKQDQVWKAIDWNMQRIYTVDGAQGDSGIGLAGMSKAMWDATNLYILFYTVDDIIVDLPAQWPANPYQMDAVEFYFDKDNDKATKSARGPTQYQFTIPHYLLGKETSGVLGNVFGAAFDTVGCEFAISDVDNTQGFPGFMVEAKIKLASLGVDGATAANQLVGWELQQDENDDAAGLRTFMSKWWNQTNMSWANPGIWGTAILSSREVDTVLQIVKASQAPTIDGQMDPEYKNANSVTMNLFRVDATATDTADSDPIFGGFITAYPMWDATNMYIFLDVVDGVVVDLPAQWPANPYQMDAVELYFDGTNDHSTKTARGANQYQFTIPHYLMGKETSGVLGNVFGTSFDTVGCEFKIVDRDMRLNAGSLTMEGSGYNVEVKIPLASLSIEGSTAGALLGFELQLDNNNDAAGLRDGMEKWWNETNMSWANPGIWGYAQLAGERIDVRVKPSPSVISSYSLEQNYPNPFNPSTEITFELAKAGKVKLAVYNLLGEQVAELVNGVMSAASHTVTFNANNLASGVYFYRLEAGGTVMAKKMILLK